ncbi:dihydrofolate reductase family protein [Micromonospora sp. NPDC049230]|uniref:dihydrofolate reductase family protein n=1 Tax=Micromonospora sp. NPDC049230 TaxID=3155502 RepID=UPI0033C53989
MRKIVVHMSVSLDGFFEGPGGDIGWHQVDEYRIYVHPVLLGRGRRLFPEADAPTGLRLAESRTFGNGVVLLRHERAR